MKLEQLSLFYCKLTVITLFLQLLTNWLHFTLRMMGYISPRTQQLGCGAATRAQFLSNHHPVLAAPLPLCSYSSCLPQMSRRRWWGSAFCLTEFLQAVLCDSWKFSSISVDLQKETISLLAQKGMLWVYVKSWVPSIRALDAYITWVWCVADTTVRYQ